MTDEKELIGRLAGGEPSAFRDLVETHKKRVYFLALDMVGNPVDAEDISQEVFLKVFRSFGTFNREARLGSWLYRITYNACIDHLRKKAITPEPVDGEALETGLRKGIPIAGSAEIPDPVSVLERSSIGKRIEAALACISPQEKAVFVLRHYEDLSLKEIAETLGLSLGSVKSYLFRAIQKLRKELGPLQAGPETEFFHE
ncbi:MAG: RNA polymerase sigma factor [Candidatus Aminicenantales bacterium]